MVDVNDGRHFSNPFSDWSPSSAQPFELDSKWKDAVTARLKPLIEELYYQSAQLPSSDISMYTGLAGIGYFFHRLSVADNTLFDTEKRQRAAENAQKIASRCLRHLDINRLYKNVSVFTSSVGALCLTVLSYRSDTAPSGATAASPSVEECLKQVLRAHEFAVAASSDMPNEALYGRTGYLNALVMLHSAGISVPNDIMSSVVNAILSSGVRKAKQYQADGQYRALMRRTEHRDLPMPPLMFDWHDKAYLGGAHGFAGILLTLLKVSQLLLFRFPLVTCI
ncbi:LanC protein 1 [Fasciola gigantica]|uniref:LanC protein 1 n=1 Tax=Fasciola gigantica TaxID=46835 RepID=A0A504YRP7_FASGI|nr:LanC protein 1 [Fasciola gigantica]